MEKPKSPETLPHRILRRVGLALGALTLGAMTWPEGPLQAGDIWVGGYGTPVEGQAETTDHLSIATYNVKNGHVDREGVEDTIVAMDADIVGLNEMSPRLAMRLSAGQYQYRFGETIRTDEGPYGNAVLINEGYEVTEFHNFDLPSGNHEQRGVLHVEVDTGDEVLNVYVTHLTQDMWRNSRSDVRFEQARYLTRFIEAFGPDNAVVLGDLNEESGPAYNHLAASLSDGVNEAGLGYAATFSNGYTQRRYDHIMLDPDFGNVSSGMRTGSEASDHEGLAVGIDTSPAS